MTCCRKLFTNEEELWGDGRCGREGGREGGREFFKVPHTVYVWPMQGGRCNGVSGANCTLSKSIVSLTETISSA